jgi:RecB family exonuclease
MSNEIPGLEDPDYLDEPEYRELALPGGYLSASRINKYNNCPEAFRRSYIVGKRFVANARMAQGTTVHSLVELALGIKMRESRMPTSEEVLDHAASAFASAFEGIEDWEDTNESAWLDHTQKLYMLWHKTVAPTIVPVALEQRIEEPIAGIKIVGYIDIIDASNGQKTIIDLKVAKRGKTDKDARNSLQLGLYSATTGIMNVGFDSLVKKKEPEIKLARATLTEGDHSWIAEIVSSTADAIEAGAFPKAPMDSWLCTEKWCEHWDDCRGKHVTVAVAGIE